MYVIFSQNLCADSCPMQPEMQHTNSDLSISVLYPAISSFVFQGSQETCRGAVICRVAGIRAIHLMLLLWNRSFFLVITSCCPWFLSQLPWPATLAISYRIIFFLSSLATVFCFESWNLEQFMLTALPLSFLPSYISLQSFSVAWTTAGQSQMWAPWGS